jgi:uncharacterized protein
MKIRLDQVRFEPFRWQETCEVPLESLKRPEVLALSPVTWRGQVTYAAPSFHFKARLGYEQTLACDRCLKPFPEQVASDLEVMISVAPPQRVSGEHELHEKDLGVLFVPDETLETEPLLLEQVLLNLPMKPLCRPDCAGLCKECGADLNLGPCGCEQKTIDPRWGALAAIRERMNDN